MKETTRVLIVEDVPADAELAQWEVRKSLDPCQFRQTETKEGFVDALGSFYPDIIISDYRMPVFDGMTVLKTTQQLSPETPVIILTGSMNEDTAVECMKAGAVDYVIKEHIKRLGQSVIHALKKKKLYMEHRKAEQMLIESEERYRRLAENAPDIIFRLDMKPTPHVSYISPAVRTITGYSPEEFLNKRTLWTDIVHPDDRVGLFKPREIGGCAGEPDIIRWIHKNSDIRWIEVRYVPIYGKDGCLVAMEGIARDITDQRALEAALYQAQKMEAIGRLSGGIAHDFNNMLQVILGYSAAVLSDITPENEFYPDIKEIKSAGERAADLTRQLLAFARKQEIDPRNMNINSTISDMRNMLKRLIGENIAFDWVPGEDLWDIRIDPSQLDQIMANLVVNARDAINGAGRITVRTANMSSDTQDKNMYPGFVPGDYVLLSVKDTGSGMDNETIHQIFEPFFTTKEKGKGTGLGLSTVYGIVKQNKGFVYTDSKPGAGTTFSIFLPRCTAPDADIPAEENSTNTKTRTGTILLVEDEPQILNFVKQALSRMGFQVLAAGTPEKALELAEAYKDIQLLITDVIMPDMNGRELKEKLENMISGLKTIFISGYTSDVIASHSVLESGIAFIRKPFSLSTLKEKVWEMI